MRLQYTLRGQFQEYWDTAGVKSGDVLTFQRNTPTSGKIKVGRYPQGRGLETVLDTGGGSYSNATTASKESTIVAATSKPTAPLPLSNLGRGLNESRNTSGGSLRIREQQQKQQQQQQQQQKQHVDADAGGAGSAATGHPNRWTELPDGSAAKTVYKSTLVHQQCPIAGWLYRKLYGRAPGDTDTAPMRDPALATNFLFEVGFVPAANVHYISGKAFGTWMKSAGVQSGDQIRVWKDKTEVNICRMANNNSRFGGGLMGPEVEVEEQGFLVAPHQHTFTSPPGVEALAALNALAAAAGYAGQHGTPAIDAVLSHAADLRNLVTSGQQEVDALISIGDALKSRLAADGMPLPPSPFLTGTAGAGAVAESEKKRKNEALDLGFISKYPRNSNEPTRAIVPITSSQGIATVLPPPPAPSAAPGQVQPGQLQLQQALQQLIRHYQTHMHQQQPHKTSTASNPPPPPPIVFHRATPAATVPPPPPPAPRPSAQQQQQQQQQSPPNPTFAAVTTALNLHQWSPSEAALLVQFRVTCAVLDSVGRDIAFTNVLQLQNNKEALLAMIRGVVGADRAIRGPDSAPTIPNSEGVSIAAAPAMPLQPADTAGAREEEEN
jgi:hypothetical protein